MVVEDSSVVLGGSFFIFGMAGRSSDRPRQPLPFFFLPRAELLGCAVSPEWLVCAIGF
jgi:hypothetical protein